MIRLRRWVSQMRMPPSRWAVNQRMRVLRVRVAVAKLDIYESTGVPGIRIERRRKALRSPYEEV